MSLSRQQAHSQINAHTDGDFIVFAIEGSVLLAYAHGGAVLEERVELTNDSAKLQRESLKFFSLCALVAYHFCEPGALRCLLLPNLQHVLVRSRLTTGAGRSILTARSRVDAAASSSSYYLGGVPEEVALDALDGGFDGAFVVRDSLSDMHLLWLHYVDAGRVHHQRIRNTPNGLHIESSPTTFDTLSELITFHVNHGDNDAGVTLRLGWGVIIPIPAPPIGVYDHLTAPWFFENLSREEANEQLDYHPTGTFVCRVVL